MWMLEELNEPYTQIAAGPRTPEAMQYNPSGKIPALVDGDDVLTDSVAIMTYLGDKHGKLTAPAGTPARARQDAMIFWLIDEMDAVQWTYAKNSFVRPEAERVPEIKDSLKAEFTRNADLLADRIQGPFLMGDQITHADILAVHCLNWSIGAGFPRVNDTVGKWAAGLRERDAFKAAQAKVAS
jgi:glutathione S-transferase